MPYEASFTHHREQITKSVFATKTKYLILFREIVYVLIIIGNAQMHAKGKMKGFLS
jgi:hypothetical protein